MLYDGWILRFSQGYTKRANSVNPLYGSSAEVGEKIGTCENLYRERGLRPIFRLTPFAAPLDLDLVLESRGYRKIAPTLVLYLDLERCDFLPLPAGELRDEGLNDWLGVFCEFSHAALEKHQAHRAILQAIPSRRFLATLADAGQVVACGLGVLENRFFGLFDLITHPERRNKGYGSKLVSGLLAWARENGARHAYLQVMKNNAPARHLYADKLGFRRAYAYWYRVVEECPNV